MYNKLDIKELIDFTKTLKILYVEDNDKAREALLSLIDNYFDHIDIATNGKEGLNMYLNSEETNNSYDLILSDIRMPKMNGIEMIQNIRDTNDNNISVIVVTAHKETDLLIDCIQSGVNGYLLKPVNYEQFEQAIRQVCEKIFYKQKHEEHESLLEELVKSRTKELEDAQDDLIEMANKDYLTNLYNRRYFQEISHSLMKIAHREKKQLSLLILDIDRFKTINDNYGHIVGDIVIKQLANILKNITRQSDILVRFGGEEFIVILPNTKIDGATLIAKKIREEVEKYEVQIEKDNILKFTVSIGVTQCECTIDNNV